MNIDDKVKALMEKIQSGKMDEHLKSLDGSDFGLYIPVYVDKATVKPMLEGYSQNEKNLTVLLSKDAEGIPADAKPVAWMGGQIAKDSKCNHGGTSKCKHCTGHASHCRHCTHKAGKLGGDFVAPELDYDGAFGQLENKKDLLESLSKEEIGLVLLHGHNDKFMFTKLPPGYVSVISGDKTTFRTQEEVSQDNTFVPNMWRSVEGKLLVAGGYSEN